MALLDQLPCCRLAGVECSVKVDSDRPVEEFGVESAAKYCKPSFTEK